MKELTDPIIVNAFRVRFEAGRSFDLDDDLEFCPGLLTDDDVRLPSSGFNAHSFYPAYLSNSSPTVSSNTLGIFRGVHVERLISILSAPTSNPTRATGRSNVLSVFGLE